MAECVRTSERVSCTEYFKDAICYSLSTMLQPSETLCRRRHYLHVKAADMGAKARMSQILVWMRKLGRQLSVMKDLQILVDKHVVKEAEDAFAAVRDIPEAMTDSTLYASVSSGAVPSAGDMDRVFTIWDEQAQLSVAAGVKQFCSLDRRDAAAQEEKVWVLESVWSGSTCVRWGVRVCDAKRIPSHRFPQH